MKTLLVHSRHHQWLLFAAMVLLQGLMLGHAYQHPFHTEPDPPCFVHQLSQITAAPAVAILAAIATWRRLAIIDVAASIRPFISPRHGASRAPPVPVA